MLTKHPGLSPRALYLRFMRVLRNPTSRSRPAFIVGCGRSGTSMLLFRLGSSWEVQIYNEDNPAAFLEYRLRSISVTKRLVEASRAPLVLFKPILSTTLTRSLLEEIPSSKVIFLFRHHDDVINSSLRRFGEENRLNHVRQWIATRFEEFSFSRPPEKTMARIRKLWHPSLSRPTGAALYWLFYNQLFFDLGLHKSDRVLLVNYEDLVTQPASRFKQITDFLGIGLHPAMPEGVYSTSIGRHPAPTIEPRVREACSSLFQRLSERGATR